MVTVIIAAAGQGKRMGGEGNKVFLPLAGKSILAHTIARFAVCSLVDEMIIVAASGEEAAVSKIARLEARNVPFKVVSGGVERQDSINNALLASSPAAKIILVHDGARPLVSDECIAAVIEGAHSFRAAVTAVPVKDTIKLASEELTVTETPERNRLWAVHTPQGFEASLLRRAYEDAARAGARGTDDASLVERLGVAVKLVAGSYENIKVTTPEDLRLAEALLKKREEKMMRVGMGYDVHCLVEGRKLILGGEEIPYEKGLDGHSDADVLLHAVKDALLGAAALGDIGRHFPDTDQAYKGASSMKLLARVGEILVENGYRVGNIDATIIAQRPKLAPYIPAMNKNIATVLGLPLSAVNVKATTTEGLGFAGKGEGIAANAVAVIFTLAD